MFVPSNNDKGDIAEAALTFQAAGLGIPVLRPWSGHARYDLVFDITGKLLRVQCKWGRLDRCYLLPIQIVAGKHQVQLRLTRPRNSQRAGVILADDYECHGAIAQLGERSAGSRKVAGSNPASSTSSRALRSWSGPMSSASGSGTGWSAPNAGDNIVVTRRGKRQLRLSAVQPPAATPSIGPSGPSNRGSAHAGPMTNAGARGQVA
jgi:hypothetical protein